MISKVCIGTAQFGLNYGVSNSVGKLSNEEISKVLDYANESGISKIDTAMSYGDSEILLGNLNRGNSDYITKLPGFNSLEKPRDWVRKKVEGSLQKLKRSSLYAILLHRPSDLHNQYGNQIYNELLSLKRQGMISKVGISIYDPEELKQILGEFEIDIVQSPLNIIDQGLFKSGWLKELKRKKIEVHVRSIFLQGLLIMDTRQRPKKFEKWNSLWDTWQNWCSERNVSPKLACIQFVKKIKEIDNYIFGVESLEQLKEIIHLYDQEISIDYDTGNLLALNDPMLINPSNWNKF